METKTHKMKTVYTITERDNGKSFWTKIGVGFVNTDGSINLKLDAIPIGGHSIQVRDYEPYDPARNNGNNGGGTRPPRSLRDPAQQAREPLPAGPLADQHLFGGL
jgi:hypothetical protein